MSKITKIGLIILVLIAIPAGVFLISKAGPTRYRAKAGKSDEVFVFLMPAQVKIERGEKISISVKIDTGRDTIGGVDLSLQYNPTVLSLVGPVNPGSTFPRLESQLSRGQVALRSGGSLLGQGTVAVLNFEGVSLGEGSVELDETSVVWNEEITTNILGKKAGARVIVE